MACGMSARCVAESPQLRPSLSRPDSTRTRPFPTMRNSRVPPKVRRAAQRALRLKPHLIELDALAAEERYAADPVDRLSPDRR